MRELGAVRAYVQVKRCGACSSLNLLWAMEGALSDRHWQEVAKNDSVRLLLELEDVKQTLGATKESSQAGMPAARQSWQAQFR